MTRSLRMACCLAIAVVFTAVNHGTAMAQDAREQAREAFREGVAAIEQKDWKGAIEALRRSYELHPHPATLLNIATAEAADGQLNAALVTYRRYLRDSRGDAAMEDQRTQAKRVVRDLEARLAHVRITVVADPPVGVSVTLDGQPIDAETLAGKMELDPGAHRFVLSRDGTVLADLGVALAEGETRGVELRDDGATPASVAENAVLGAPAEDNGPAGLGAPRDDGTPSQARDGGSIFETWWFWTIAGAVVLGGVVTTVALSSSDAAPSKGNVSPSVHLP